MSRFFFLAISTSLHHQQKFRRRRAPIARAHIARLAHNRQGVIHTPESEAHLQSRADHDEARSSKRTIRPARRPEQVDLQLTPQSATIIGNKLFDALVLIAEGNYAQAALALDELHEEIGRLRYGQPGAEAA
jgi:hypothetical protein